ncbi:MAG TPA: helix-turn-helix transcriptional regulator [Solirubrobacterales bacterium]|nr:helix-turn-helix transcriptional regulator [Solirubrobacterales bacterium]
MPPRRRAKPRSPDHAALGRAIQALREEAGLTQEDVATRIGRDSPAVGNLERGTANPTYESLLGLAAGLETELSELFGRAEEIRRNEGG